MLLKINPGLSTIRNYSNVKIIKNPTTTSLKRGTGGRSSFNGIVCTVFGNTGFLGRYVCNRLGKIGTQVILPYRGDHYNSMPLKLVGDLGQVLFHPFDVRDEDSIRRSIKYSNVVVNLIGRDWETRNFTYEDVHVTAAETLARICRETPSVERFIHVSCLGASDSPPAIFGSKPSKFFQSKYDGELAVKREFPEATIVRPSLIYGQEDRFFNTYGRALRRHFRSIPLWEKGEKTFKYPIWSGDVAAGITALVRDPKTAGKTYQFLGPERYKLADLIDWMYAHIRHEHLEYGYRCIDIKYAPLFQLKVSLLGILNWGRPHHGMHWEGLEKEHISDVPVPGLPSLEDLGINPVKIGSRIKWELAPFKIEASYNEKLGEFPAPIPPEPAAALHL